MSRAPIAVGDVTVFRKTVTETDMVLFSGITGDFAANHTDEEYMRRTPYGTRHVHGALVVGFMSTVAARALEDARPSGLVPVSLGYDRLRFVRAVFPGQTLQLRYEFVSWDPEARRATATVEAFVSDEVVAAGTHIVVWVPAEPA
ncbi:MaoC family dehydratase [Tersicoccus solisilvae]|uniref:MaoC family dehydratase n=1 Tax=Tersicoccus solisilvae TaxID=1882339 RepID=A0ABQ1PML1_9MICC|nr:MaoC/PaaZ C-terminal domain-containing protein [Tersicoccus solisilvae]GGC99713.1 MaoC family dehydratase [Tersicoccus solisilvae]